MSEFNLGDLIDLLRDSADQDSQVATDINPDNATESFESLGFDSLALFNVVTRVEQKYNISVGYDAMTEAKSPKALFELLQRRLSPESA